MKLQTPEYLATISFFWNTYPLGQKNQQADRVSTGVIDSSQPMKHRESG